MAAPKDAGRPVTRRKRLLFALVAAALASAVAAGLLLVVDVFMHSRFEKSAGYNTWGYRGPSLPAKRPGEVRAAMLGGSTAFGYGVTWDQAIPAVLERELNQRAGLPPVTVANLAYNNEGAYSFRYTLEDYLWLDYDLAILYEGYNDVPFNPPDANTQVFRHESPIFRLTGYLPIFPMVFREKAAALLTGGAPSEAYSYDKKTVFRPGLSARGAAGLLNAAASAGQALETQLQGLTDAPPRSIPDDASTGCAHPWGPYCRSVLVAIEFAFSHGKQVLVVGQPFFPPNNKRSERHLHQQAELNKMLDAKFAGNHRVRYVPLGHTVDLSNEQHSFDEMHLTADANRIVAAALAAPVAEMIAAPKGGGR
jgi:hypothetical protein